MSKPVKVAVAEPSPIVRYGLLAILKEINILQIHVIEISEIAQLKNTLNWHQPDVIIINPLFLGMFTLQQIRKESSNPELKCIGLQHIVSDSNIFACFDEVISLNDTPKQVGDKLINSINHPINDKKHKSLSQREIEILTCIIKGMTNKEIADNLCLSTHTVTTHKRNISTKLNIHSTAGLIIYGIINKLIELDEVRNTRY